MSSDSTPAKRGRPPRFSREEVLAAALNVIDAEAPEAFTMRRVADELGMGVMTLYGYVRSKEELLEGLTVLVYAELRGDEAATVTWDELLRAEVRGLHGIGLRHPNLVTLVLAQSSAAPGLFRIRERMLGALREAGFQRSEALHALGSLTSYALGFAGAQAGAVPLDVPERLSELPEAEFPHLSAFAQYYEEHLSDAAFEFGLDLLIGGLQSTVAPRGNAHPPRSS
jgi:AcrR family transcriptional regulator